MIRKGKKGFVRAVAGCLALFMTFGSGAAPAQASEAAKKTVVKITSTTFPDANFRAYVKDAFDKDKNGSLDTEEVLYARNIWCQGMKIKSLKGIEYLTELRGLYCMDNQLTSLDLSKNQQITGVWCSGNLFTSLDFSANPTLEWVYCFDCKLTSLNVTKNPKMSYIECNSNPLKSLDVSKNPELEHLTCGDCGLTSLDLRNNPKLQHLDAFKNKLKKLDVTCCPLMKRLDIWDNPGLGSINVSKCPGLQYYNCANNGAKSVNVSSNPELVKLICSYNHESLTSLDVSKNPKLVYLDCSCNEISKLDLSKNTELYYLMAFTNPFTKLNIGNCRRLVKVYKDGVRKDESAVCKGQSWTLDYGGDSSTGDDNKYVLVLDYKVTVSTKQVGAGYVPPAKKAVGDTKNLITREAAVYTLYNLAGQPKVSGKSRFKDVKAGSWYANAVLWGEQNNAICVGSPDISDDTFGVGEWITREDLTLMLMRYAEYKKYKRDIDFGRSDEYKDYYDIDYYAWEAVCWACTWNIMAVKGKADAPKSEQSIDPQGIATRQDLETMLSRMYEVNGLTKKPKMVTGWKQVNGTWYYITQAGGKTGWFLQKGKWYFFDKTGAMKTGWLKQKGKWYYLDKNGVMKTGWLKVDGKWYYFNTSGSMASNEFVKGWWVEKSGVQRDSVRYKWYRSKRGWWYGVNGGWYAKGKSYVIDGTKYTFDKKGYCLNP